MDDVMMATQMARLASAVYWAFVAIAALALFPIALVVFVATVAFDRRRVASHALTCVWASLYTWASPWWRVRVIGAGNLDAAQPCVIVANHSSAADIFVIYRLFRHFKWVSKAENFRVPVIGWNMRLCGYIPLRRGDRASVVAMLDACVRELGRGSSVLLFPEGTRSTTDELRPFKAGAFEVAQRAGVPIVPIALEGTRAALPKRGFVVSRATMTVRVLPAITPDAFASLSPQEVADMVRAQIVGELARVA